MATLKELRDERLRKLEQLKQLGLNPYPANVHRTHEAGEVINDFKKLDGKVVSVTGRVVSIRKFGKIAFLVVKDASGQIQLFLTEELLPLKAEDSQLGLKEDKPA